MDYFLVLTSSVIPFLIFFISLAFQVLTAGDDENKEILWGNQLCLLSISAFYPLFYTISEQFSSMSTPQIYCTIALPFSLLLIDIIALISVYILAKKKSISSANNLGLFIFITHFFLNGFHNVILKKIIQYI